LKGGERRPVCRSNAGKAVRPGFEKLLEFVTAIRVLRLDVGMIGSRHPHAAST
jgi:hypothetical protein